MNPPRPRKIGPNRGLRDTRQRSNTPHINLKLKNAASDPAGPQTAAVIAGVQLIKFIKNNYWLR